jgi:type I restriction enzyme S subunit
MIDLLPAQLVTIRNILSKCLGNVEVWAFGSRINWTATPGSDLDLVIHGEHPTSFDSLSKIHEAFIDSNLPFRVDLLDWARIPEHFKKNILKNYEKIYPTDSDLRTLDWDVMSLKEFAPLHYGRTLSCQNRMKGSFPVYDSNGIVEYIDKAYVKSPGIIIGRKERIGSIYLSEFPFFPLDTTFYIEDDPSTRDLKFTYYLLKALSFQTMDRAPLGLTRDEIHSLIVKVPKVSEQKAIVAALNSLGDESDAHLPLFLSGQIRLAPFCPQSFD